MTTNEPADAQGSTWRELAVARSLDSARARAENRVQRFIDAALELIADSDTGKDFTVQEVVERSGQSLRSFYQYFGGKQELLLALFEETVRSSADQVRERVGQEDDPLERLHRFVVEYYRLCRPTRRGRAAKKGSPLALAEFAQQLMTAHPEEATRAYAPIVSLFEEVLGEAVEAGAVRGDLERRRLAGVVLEAIMFNAFSTTIAGSSARQDGGDPAEELWDLLLNGIRSGGLEPMPDSPIPDEPMPDELGTSALRFERDGVIAWCTIDRPSARNALTPAMYYGIKRAVRLVNRDPELAALIITGSGDVFAPGGDLGGRSEEGEAFPEDAGEDILPFLTIRDSPAPVIAAVNGICQAGGLLIAMMADIAVVSDQATFRVPELLRGIPDATYAAALPAHVGVAVARDLLLSARRFDAAEAERIGLISRVVPHDQLREAAVDAARQILQTAPGAHVQVKRMLNERYGLIDYQTMFWELEHSEEPREGMRAFMEKRPPGWVP